MKDIKVHRVYGKKTATLSAWSFLISIAVVVTANNKPPEIPNQTMWLAFIIFLALLFFFTLASLLFRYSIVRFTESEIWQWQPFSAVSIPWSDVQKVEAFLGGRTIISGNKMIILQFEDFKEPDTLVLEIKKRVPKGVFDAAQIQ